MTSIEAYFDQSGRDDVLTGGVRMVSVTTPSGRFRVWTKRVGNNPALKVLLLHGGPGLTHEYLEPFDSYLPGAGVEYYYYDQLGSGNSDHPDDMSLWEIDRFVDEVEQVRIALGLGRDNFVLYGQSWGAVLAVEYAMHHQQHLRGMVLSNMASSSARYNEYVAQVLMPQMDQTALAEITAIEDRGDFDDPRFMELLEEHFYSRHMLRIPAGQTPEPAQRSFTHMNQAIYVKMQGHSELRISPDASLAGWDRTEALASITVPTLVIGASHDTMDPDFLRTMANRLPNGQYLHCPNGSHLCIYDDQPIYFAGIIDFLDQLPP